MIEDKCPFPYEVRRIAVKIFIPEKRYPNEYNLIPFNANEYTSESVDEKRETIIGATK